MELFSEVYGCYFTVVSRILDQAQNGLTKAEIEQLVSSHGFYDSTFHLPLRLITKVCPTYTREFQALSNQLLPLE